MTSSEYNQRQVDKGAWAVGDLPGAWPGRQVAIDQGVNSAQFIREVKYFQAGAGLKPDGKIGTKTLAALTRTFRGPGPATILLGVAGAIFLEPMRAEARPANTIQGRFGPLGRRIVDLWNQYGASIADQADRYKIPIRAALSVFATEAGSDAYDPETGLIIIRFERHIFERLAGRSGTTRGHDGSQATEWAMLRDAADISTGHAFASTSFGLPQIMGFNYAAAGYQGPVDMATTFQDDVTEQVKSFFTFCRAGDLDGFIRRRDWRGFTRRYNGPGQVEHYSGVLQQYLAAAETIDFK